MASFNKIILIGNLTRDPQLSYLPSQTPVCEFGLATNRRWKSQDGQQREETCFIDCRAFGKQAETLNQYLSKGRQLFVEGRLSFDTWETQDGQKRSKHRVTIENFQFLDGGQGGARAAGGTGGGAAARPPAARPAAQGGGSGGAEYPPPEDEFPASEDIPF